MLPNHNKISQYFEGKRKCIFLWKISKTNNFLSFQSNYFKLLLYLKFFNFTFTNLPKENLLYLMLICLIILYSFFWYYAHRHCFIILSYMPSLFKKRYFQHEKLTVTVESDLNFTWIKFLEQTQTGLENDEMCTSQTVSIVFYLFVKVK